MRAETKTTITLESEEIKDLVAKHLNLELPHLPLPAKPADISIHYDINGEIQAIFSYRQETEI